MLDALFLQHKLKQLTQTPNQNFADDIFFAFLTPDIDFCTSSLNVWSTMILNNIRQKVGLWLRAFKIWQKTGNGIWVSTRTEREQKRHGIFHGAFDSIPFLNDDAKRTFVHLLLRPGYMMRDYICGKHDIYMAPFAALIIFYSFFAALSPVMHLQQQTDKPDFMTGVSEGIKVQSNSHFEMEFQANPAISDSMTKPDSTILSDSTSQADKHTITFKWEFGDDNTAKPDSSNRAFLAGKLVAEGWKLLHLDQNPQYVDAEWKARLAALESVMRSQGVSMFIGDFLLLCMAMFIGLRRKHDIKLAAAAAVAGYALCQVCFFKIFVMLFTLGRDIEAGLLLTVIILIIDYRQLLGISYKRSIWLTIKTGLLYVLLLLLLVTIGGLGAFILV